MLIDLAHAEAAQLLYALRRGAPLNGAEEPIIEKLHAALAARYPLVPPAWRNRWRTRQPK